MDDTTYYWRLWGYNLAKEITTGYISLVVKTERDIEPPSKPEDIDLSLPEGREKVREGDVITLTAKVEEWSRVYKVLVKDEEGRLIDEIELGGERAINKTIAVGEVIEIEGVEIEQDELTLNFRLSDIRSKYPYVRSIQIGIILMDTAGNISEEVGLSEAIELEAKRDFMEVYNNIFNPTRGESVVIMYEIKEPCNVKIEVYNIFGEKIKTLVDEYKSQGIYKIQWDGKNENNETTSSNIYIVYIKTKNLEEKKKVCLIR